MYEYGNEKIKISCEPVDSNSFVCRVYKNDEYIGSYKFLADEDKIEFEAENPREVKEVLRELGLGEDDLKRYVRP